MDSGTCVVTATGERSDLGPILDPLVARYRSVWWPPFTEARGFLAVAVLRSAPASDLRPNVTKP